MEPLILLALACSLSALACAGVVAVRSVPSRLRRTVAECSQLVAELETQWRAERASLQGYLEEVQGVMESVEKKRRQTAASASRVAQLAGNSGEPDFTRSSPEVIREHFTRVARERGLL